MWKTYKILRKMATGVGKHGDIINLPDYSNGTNWENTNICVGISNINVSRDTNKIVTSYSKLDNNRFQLVSYTDNTIYSSKVEDTINLSVRSGDNKSQSKDYTGNQFYLNGLVLCNTWNDEAKANGGITYNILKDGTWVGEVTLVSHSTSGHSGDKVRQFDKILEFDKPVTLRVNVWAGCNRKGSASTSFSVYGGTKTSGNLIYGSLEWFAYES